MNTPDHSLPPHSVDAEQSIIGGLLLDGNAFDRIADMVSDADFYRDGHRRIFRHVALMFGTGKPIDVVTVAESIDASGESEQTGGLGYLGELTANTPGVANIRRYAEIVREKSMLRQLQDAATAIHAACASAGGRTADQIAAEAESSMLAAVDRSGSEPKALPDVFSEALAYVDERCAREGKFAGLTTGFYGFDSLTGGFEPGQLIVVAARPSVGKTMFACNVADNVAQRNQSALFFTLEMSTREIGARLLSARSKVSVHAMRTGTNDPDHWCRMSDQAGKANKQRLFVDDKSAIGVGYIRAKARRIKRQHGLDLVVIDYLGLMTGKGDNRTQEIGSISRGLKALAKELGVPIMLMAQLNRGVENRADKRPMLSDLRDSGEIEQDADIVVMLHREYLYSPAAEWNGLAELLLRKNRNGPLGEIILHFLPEQMAFANYEGPNIRQQIQSGNFSQRDVQKYQQRSRGFND